MPDTGRSAVAARQPGISRFPAGQPRFAYQADTAPARIRGSGAAHPLRRRAPGFRRRRRAPFGLQFPEGRVYG